MRQTAYVCQQLWTSNLTLTTRTNKGLNANKRAAYQYGQF